MADGFSGQRSVQWFSLALSGFLYHFSMIKLTLMIGKSISAGPSVYITSPDGLAEHKAKLMSGTNRTYLGLSKDKSPLKNSIGNFSC